MSRNCVIAIDAGTTGVTALLIDETAAVVPTRKAITSTSQNWTMPSMVSNARMAVKIAASDCATTSSRR